MTTAFTFARDAALAALCVSCLAATPAVAAPEDVALLHEYLGNWKGTGEITGPKGNTERTNCRLDLIDGNGDKINFRGRCSLSGTTVTMTGAMAFVDATQRYEAVMTTSVGFFGEAVGVREGDRIRFDLAQIGGDPSTDNMDVTASFIMAGGGIDVGITVVFKDSGDRYVAAAPLSK